ncbi:MAG: YraN family protein [Bacteroidales bacterium]|nr:YraN family protein [Bacteroidales bacterium]
MDQNLSRKSPTEKMKTGQDGEDVAVKFLTYKGLTILHRNWRMWHKEVDIIARDGDEIVFVEVKTRRVEPVHTTDVITQSKMKNLIAAASAYITMNKVSLDCRFDVIILTGRAGKYSINYIPNAFRQYLR